MLNDVRLFYSEFRNTFKTTGAIAPSSPMLAKAMTLPLSQRSFRPVSVLEVGPGTGSFTRAILKHLRPGDQIDIYELNPRFHGYLLQCLPWQDYIARGIQCSLQNADVRQVGQDVRYDYIVCGLPFNNFEPHLVADILSVLIDRLALNGVFSYFEYIFSHEFKARFLKEPAERERMIQVGITVRRFMQKHQFGCNQVWFNLPPARARYCRKKAR